MNLCVEIDPYLLVTQQYVFPFDAREFQHEAIIKCGPLQRSGLFHQPGLGKTFSSTICALFHRLMGTETTLVLMPPILIKGWAKWLSRVTHKDGTPLKVLEYRGTPKERKAMSLTGHDFVLMSMPIFKRDYPRIVEELGPINCFVINDEATCVKNCTSDNYKKFRDFTLEKPFQLLTGTPLDKVEDAYAYIKLMTPEVYKSMHQFASIHIEEVDFFGKPKKYCNLELLQSNLLIAADRKLKRDVLKDIPEPVVTPMYYDLVPEHKALYTELANEQMLKFENGTKIDATSVSALWQALQQIVINWGHFAQDESLTPAGFELIQEVLDEIAPAKLMVFANYKLTNRAIAKRFKHVGAVGIWGDLTDKQKDANWQRFLNDPDCRLIHMQPQSAGLGLDGAQHVCSEILFIEVPGTPLLYEQCYSRLDRDGQTEVVNIRIAAAEGTCQVRSLRNVTLKQDLVMSVQGGLADLKAAVFGS